MDKELDYATLEDLMSFIQGFLKDSKTPLDFGLFFTKGMWKANLTGFPSVFDTDLRSALYLLALHLKLYKDDELSYR